MTRTLADSRRWAAEGTAVLSASLDAVPDGDLDAPSLLPGWTRKHLVAHVAANADAIGNLVRWAATGKPTPMYASPEQRGADIEAGSRRPERELREWCAASAAGLERGMDALGDSQWGHEVLTAQGRAVPASETPWMRAREVMVHAVDLGTGLTFADLPTDFLRALADDAAVRRSSLGTGPAVQLVATDAGDRWQIAGTGTPTEVHGPLAAVAAYLTGRGDDGVTGPDGTPAPTLPAWL